MTIQELFENNVHIGHRKNNWNAKMRNFIFGKKGNFYFFDLEKTVAALEKVKIFLESAKVKNQKILFIGTKPQAEVVIEEEVEKTKNFFISGKWCAGLLTNFSEVRKRIDYYLNLKLQFESGEIRKYTKKEVAKFKKELEKLDILYRGVAEMKKRPDAIIVLDSVENELAIEEAKKMRIPIIAIADTNSDPDGIDFLVPGNDDSVKSVRFLCQKFLEFLK